MRRLSPVPCDTMLDARVARSRAAVVRAATDLLVEGGPSAVTIDAIVARSGVAKSTIYRHWTSRDDILLDVLEACAPDLPEPDADLDVEQALRAIGRSIAAILNDPEWARIIPALLMLKTHEHGVADLEQRLERHQKEVIGRLMARGVTEGVLRSDAAEPEAVAQLVGPLMFAHLTGAVAIEDGFVQRTIDRFLAAYRR